MTTKTETAIANFTLINRTLQLNNFLDLLLEAQLATLVETEDLIKDTELESPTRRQLMSYLEAIASSSKLTGEAKDRAIALVEPWVNPQF